MRAAEKAVAISAAPPTSATTMKPTKAGVMPNDTAATCTEFDEHLAHQGDQQRDAGQRRQRKADRPRRLAALFGLGGGEQRAVRAEREQQAEPVGCDQQHRQPDAQLWVNSVIAESACDTADGTSKAMVARKSSVVCRRALTRLNSCT